MMKINIRRTLILICVFGLGALSGHLITKSSFGSLLSNETIKAQINKHTTSVTNKVQLKKNKGELNFSPSTNCDSLVKIFIDTTTVREFRRMKK